MAAKTPTAASGTNGVEPNRGVYVGANAANAALATNGTNTSTRDAMRLQVFYFSDIDDGDTWDDAPPGAMAVAWQADQADTDKVGATITTQGGGGTASVVTFDAENANSNGWLWVLVR